MGFDRKIINLYMSCMSSVQYQISHAGKYFGSIVPEQGLRQGDPLSSYLFHICIEGLSALLRDSENRKLLKGIKVDHSAPSISHIFFADDAYIFCKASTESVDHILQISSVFEKASGQQINEDKSSVFFSKNTPNSLKTDLYRKFRFQEANDQSTYLGLPNTIGRNKSILFGFMKEKLQNRIQGWDKKMFSKGGKEILLKTVAKALPSYAMGVFITGNQLVSRPREDHV